MGNFCLSILDAGRVIGRSRQNSVTAKKAGKAGDMEVPKTVVEMASSVDQQTGPALIDSVVQATGLPSQIVESELGSILVENGMDPSTLTLEQLRAALLNYLESCAAEFEQLDAEQAMHLGSEYAPEGAAEVANS